MFLGLAGTAASAASLLVLTRVPAPHGARGLASESGPVASALEPAPSSSYPRIAVAPRNPFAVPSPPAVSMAANSSSAPQVDLATAATSLVTDVGRLGPVPVLPPLSATGPLEERSAPPALGQTAALSVGASGTLPGSNERQVHSLPHLLPPKATLKGIIRGEPDVAFLDVEGHSRLVRQGDSLGAWRVAGMTDRAIVLTSGTRRWELPLESGGP
jgi:hypothetical protein